MELVAFYLATKDMVILALVAVAVAAVVAWFIKKDAAIEERRMNMLKVGSKMESLGWTRVAGILQAYAVGDYSGVYARIKTLVDDLSDPDAATDLVGQAVHKALPKLLETDGHREKILRAVRTYQAVHPEKDPVTGAEKAAVAVPA